MIHIVKSGGKQKKKSGLPPKLRIEDQIFGIAEYRYNFAPQPPILGEQDNLEPPKFGG